MGRQMEVIEVTEISAEVADAVRRLLPQLSSSAKPSSDEQIKQITEFHASRLLVASEAGSMLGMPTLVIFRPPTGVRAWIEDVVVDSAARGRSVGEALNREALVIAKSAGARTVGLTSRPDRDAANRLYKRIGFAPRKSNIYRLEPGDR